MRTLCNRVCVGVALACVALAAGPVRSEDKAERIAPDKLPAKISQAVKGRFADAEVTSAEKEVEDGKTVFDIELKQGGKKYEMDILADGTVVEIEKEQPASKLPEAGAKAIEQKYPKSSIKEVMEVNKVEGSKETPINYEVTIETADKKSKELLLNLDGSIKEEAKAEEKK